MELDMEILSDPTLSTQGIGDQPVITRRALMTATAALVLAMTTDRQSFADDAKASVFANFYAVSKTITGKSYLSSITSARIYDALLIDHPDLPSTIAALGILSDRHVTALQLKEAATEARQGDLLSTILTAWYTGTIETSKGPVVVAYREALMYRPVADGLIVPTYCNKGPMWWTGLPPQIARMPINNPKVL